MTPLILLAAMVGLPFLLTLVARVSAVYLLLSLLVGDILVRYLGDDVVLVASTFMRNFHSDFAVQLVLLLLPVVLTLLLMRKSAPKSQFLLHILPLLAVSLAGLIVALPLLPGGLQHSLTSTPTGTVLKNSQDLIMAITGVAILMLAWLTGRHKEERSGKHHK